MIQTVLAIALLPIANQLPTDGKFTVQIYLACATAVSEATTAERETANMQQEPSFFLNEALLRGERLLGWRKDEDIPANAIVYIEGIRAEFQSLNESERLDFLAQCSEIQ